MSNYAMGSLGFAVQALLRQANAPALRDLLSPSVFRVLECLDPQLAEPDQLRAVALRLVDPAGALRDEAMRVRLINMLPLAKARELSGVLGKPISGDVYAALASIDLRDSAAEQAFFRFFGVVPEARAPERQQPTVVSIKPGYGLFDHQRTAAARTLQALASYAHRLWEDTHSSCRQAHHAIIGPANCFEAASRAPKRFLKP